MDNEYRTMFKRLMNERNELRKYIIDICKLLYIDTSQSILGANCLEFYAVLCSTAENKIKDLQEQLKRKEEALDEIKEIAKHNNLLVRDPFCGPGYRDLSWQIQNIINEAKESK